MDPLSRLGRKDKWFLGGGGGAVSAPPFPRWLLTPGFWDECHFADIRIDRLFALLVFRDGKPLRFSSYLKGWRPDRLTIMHVAGRVVIREIRCVTEQNVWVSQLDLVTDVGSVDVLLWTLHQRRPPGSGTPWTSVEGHEIKESLLSFEYRVAWPDDLPVDRSGFERRGSIEGSVATNAGSIFLSVGANSDLLGTCVLTAEAHDESPDVAASPASDFFQEGSLANGPGVVGSGFVHTLQHFRLTDRKPIQFACAAAVTRSEAMAHLDSELSRDAVLASQKSWRDYFSGVPQFDCSEELLTNHYWYRWYGLRLQTVDVRLPRYPSACVFEGIGAFRNLISYSAHCHLREVAWMHDPSLARGILQNYVFNQRADGSFPGHIYSFRPERDFYHANWGDSVLRLIAIHGLGNESSSIIESLCYYAEYLQRERDPEGSGLISVWDQNETGQEYSSRYLFADARADEWGRIDLKGVDATFYATRLNFALSHLGEPVAFLQKCKDALESLWDADHGIYKDALLNPMRLSPYMSAVGFYPLACGDARSEALTLSFYNEEHFQTPFMIPTSPVSDPFFSAEPMWKERRLNCPWNGRVWPMANSHVLESLANQSRNNPVLAAKAGQFLMNWLRMMTVDGNPSAPTCYEHYNPLTGVPSGYRGIDDYMHSWIIDLIIRHVCGMDPGDTVSHTIDCGLDWWQIAGVPCREGLKDKEWQRK